MMSTGGIYGVKLQHDDGTTIAQEKLRWRRYSRHSGRCEKVVVNRYTCKRVDIDVSARYFIMMRRKPTPCGIRCFVDSDQTVAQLEHVVSDGESAQYLREQ